VPSGRAIYLTARPIAIGKGNGTDDEARVRALKSEAAGGIVLIAAAALAMLAANLPGISEDYCHLLHWQTGPAMA
jgi:Na+/H+ antiporter NhaA